MNDTVKDWITLVLWLLTMVVLSWRLSIHEWTPAPDWVGLFLIVGLVGAALGARDAWRRV